MPSEQAKTTTWLPCTACGDDTTYESRRPAGPKPCVACGARHAIVRGEDGSGLKLLVVERSDWRRRLRDRDKAQVHAPAPASSPRKRKRKRVRARRGR